MHQRMTEAELQFYFGTSDPGAVGVAGYEVGRLVRLRAGLKDRTGRARAAQLDNRYQFEAFGTRLELDLEPNKLLVSPQANIAWVDGAADGVRRNVEPGELDCHLVHRSPGLLAAVSSCVAGQLSGFVSTQQDTFEISPLTERLQQVLSSLLFR